MPALTITARDQSSRARAGVLRTAHGDVRTPGIRAPGDEGDRQGPAARGGRRARVRDGARQHLPPAAQPRSRADRALRRARSIHGLAGADDHRLGRLSGVLDGPRHRRRGDQGSRSSGRPGEREGAILEIDESGVRFRSYVDGRVRFLSPEDSMAMQAALGSDIALVLRRVHALPRRPRLHRSARPSAPTAGSSAACAGTPSMAPRSSSSTGSCRAASMRTCAANPRSSSAASGCDGIAIGGSLGAEKAQMYEVVAWATAELGGELRASSPPPARHRRGRRSDRGRRAGDRHVRLRDAHPPRPPRHRARARPATRAGGSI